MIAASRFRVAPGAAPRSLRLMLDGVPVLARPGESYDTAGGLNHLAVVVEDLDATEARVRAEGIETHSHADYEPGRRFYFRDGDGVEYEVVSYA